MIPLSVIKNVNGLCPLISDENGSLPLPIFSSFMLCRECVKKHWYEKTCIENCRLFSFSCVQTINCQIKTSFWCIFVAECNEITMRWNRHFIINVGRVHLQTQIIDKKSIMLHNCYSWILVNIMYKNGTYQNQDYSLLQITRSGYRNEYQI